MASSSNDLTCPICSFTVPSTDSYVLQLHFEQVHTSDSPFVVKDDPEPLPDYGSKKPSERSKAKDTPSESEDDDGNWVECTEPDCGEEVLLTELNEHLDLHAAEKLTIDAEEADMQQPGRMHTLTEESTPSFLEHNFTSALPDALRNQHHSPKKLHRKKRDRSDTSSSDKTTLSRSILSFNPFVQKSRVAKPPSNTVRLGRKELGPHAWEDRMPKWLHKQLEDGPKVTIVNRIGRDGRLIKQETVQNETPGVIQILAQLSAVDRAVKEAYYCHPSTVHIGKTPKEGGFCGYRNIQMLLSYIQGAHAQGCEDFPGRTPSILKLQDIIERAWDKGINEIGRQQTGGIRDTRKYIGTPEAQALFLSTQIDCAVEMFHDLPGGGVEAHEQLLGAIEKYFQQAAIFDGSNVFKTLLPPIYLQQPGHSVTIVGFERRKDGTCNLMVFDPMFHTSPSMRKLIGRKHIRTPRPEVMQSYRRSARQLGKYDSFETLMLTAPPPLFPAWDVLRQFPDCRFLYVFFRSRTLGYDVYPEDHFLRSFPWHQYGGLWIAGDARFARCPKINPQTVATLRRITGEGASPQSSASCYTRFSSNSPTSPCPPAGIWTAASSRRASWLSALDGSQTTTGSPAEEMAPVLEATGMHCYDQDYSQSWPGYLTPNGPSLAARMEYPSPPCGRPGSPLSGTGSEDRTSSRHFHSNTSIRSCSSTPGTSPLDGAGHSVTPHSPRKSILRNMHKKQIFQTNAPHNPPLDTSPPCIRIANGIEISQVSPFSPCGTMLSYTSNRGAESGLLAVMPLSENQVAEYRFWRACGRRGCPFGCGKEDEGEVSASRRLFREEEEVVREEEVDEDEGRRVFR